MPNRFRWKTSKRRSAAQKAQVKSLHLRKQNALLSTTPEPTLLPSSPKNRPPHDTLEAPVQEPHKTSLNNTRQRECKSLPPRVTISESRSSGVALGHQMNHLPDERFVNTEESLTAAEYRSDVGATSADGAHPPRPNPPLLPEHHEDEIDGGLTTRLSAVQGDDNASHIGQVVSTPNRARPLPTNTDAGGSSQGAHRF